MKFMCVLGRWRAIRGLGSRNCAALGDTADGLYMRFRAVCPDFAHFDDLRRYHPGLFVLRRRLLGVR